MKNMFVEVKLLTYSGNRGNVIVVDITVGCTSILFTFPSHYILQILN